MALYLHHWSHNAYASIYTQKFPTTLCAYLHTLRTSVYQNLFKGKTSKCPILKKRNATVVVGVKKMAATVKST